VASRADIQAYILHDPKEVGHHGQGIRLLSSAAAGKVDMEACVQPMPGLIRDDMVKAGTRRVEGDHRECYDEGQDEGQDEGREGQVGQEGQET
jgi:hypothetical protein